MCTNMQIMVFSPKLERVLDLSIMARLLGLLRTDLLASDISAVTRVIVILNKKQKKRERDAFTYENRITLIHHFRCV